MNTGSFLRAFEYEKITQTDVIGRFGVTEKSIYNEIVLGREYLVMGIIIFQNYQGYLIDDDGYISVCPCQLFQIIDGRINLDWHYRVVDKDESIYPFIQGIIGYYELCYDNKSYENLIVEKSEAAERIYFERKKGIG